MLTVMNPFVFTGTRFVVMMRSGTRCWRKQGAQRSSASRGTVSYLAAVFDCCRSMFFITMSYSQQWQEEEVGWGELCSEQRSFPAWETKKEGNATRQIQEEQGQAQQIREETVNSAALTGQCVCLHTKQQQHPQYCARIYSYLRLFFSNCALL